MFIKGQQIFVVLAVLFTFGAGCGSSDRTVALSPETVEQMADEAAATVSEEMDSCVGLNFIYTVRLGFDPVDIKSPPHELVGRVTAALTTTAETLSRIYIAHRTIGAARGNRDRMFDPLGIEDEIAHRVIGSLAPLGDPVDPVVHRCLAIPDHVQTPQSARQLSGEEIAARSVVVCPDLVVALKARDEFREWGLMRFFSPIAQAQYERFRNAVDRLLAVLQGSPFQPDDPAVGFMFQGVGNARCGTPGPSGLVPASGTDGRRRA